MTTRWARQIPNLPSPPPSLWWSVGASHLPARGPRAHPLRAALWLHRSSGQTPACALSRFREPRQGQRSLTAARAARPGSPGQGPALGAAHLRCPHPPWPVGAGWASRRLQTSDCPPWLPGCPGTADSGRTGIPAGGRASGSELGAGSSQRCHYTAISRDAPTRGQQVTRRQRPAQEQPVWIAAPAGPFLPRQTSSLQGLGSTGRG